MQDKVGVLTTDENLIIKVWDATLARASPQSGPNRFWANP